MKELCAPFKKGEDSVSEEDETERRLRVKSRVKVAIIKGATDALRRFALSQVPEIKLPAGIRATKSLDSGFPHPYHRDNGVRI